MLGLQKVQELERKVQALEDAIKSDVCLLPSSLSLFLNEASVHSHWPSPL